MKVYDLYFLEQANEDLKEIVSYIAKDLHNPTAAQKLATKIVETMQLVCRAPYFTEAYVPVKPLKHEYRRAVVDNYLVFYWISDNAVMVSRIIYGRSDVKVKITD